MQVITVNLDNENDLKNNLTYLIEMFSTGEIKKYLKENDDSLDLNFGKEIDGSFIEYKPTIKAIIDPLDEVDVVLIDSEAAFFEATSKFENLVPLMKLLIEYLTSYNKFVGKYKTLMKTEEETYGLKASAILMRKDKSYCSTYGDLLRTFDMDHEVYEGALVQDAIETHGFCKETLALLAIRLFSACGQQGGEDFQMIVEESNLEEKLDSKNLYNSFLESLKKELYNIDKSHQEFFSTLHLESLSEDTPNLYNIFKSVRDSYLNK